MILKNKGKLKNKKDTFLLVGAKMMFAIAISFVFASCGSEKSKQESTISEIEKQTESVVATKSVSND